MVLDWLGSYFIEHQVAEKALGYFERAALMQPNEVKWQLMSASCHRRIGNYHQALQAYKDIHARFPENIECEFHFILHDIKSVGTERPIWVICGYGYDESHAKHINTA